MKKKLVLPHFKNEDEEREFWAHIDLGAYFEPKDFTAVAFPQLKPTMKPVSIRLPENLLHKIKQKAQKMNIPYQSLIKQKLSEQFL